ncbi:hypothetical protein [Aliiroseovarius sp. PTFE2010]|uniref:hypothetical protein n=1 Tax=Aliiroseovarius sp. PTFE2010 TaxID=3417190 RepID=UPI003CF46935
MLLSLRYSRGEYDAVWHDFLLRLSQEPGYVDDPDCAALTFAILTRMRRNVDMIAAQLREAGYRFAADTPRMATLDRHMNALRKAKAPFTVIAFAEIVGTVDFRAASGDGVASGLGRYDPLVFDPGYFAADYANKDWRAAQEAATPGKLAMDFSPDAFHKANVSGGESYAIDLPCERADPIVRPLGIAFLPLMRQSIAQGGFWGISAPICAQTDGQTDWDNASEIAEGRRLPDSALLKDIRAALQPF